MAREVPSAAVIGTGGIYTTLRRERQVAPPIVVTFDELPSALQIFEVFSSQQGGGASFLPSISLLIIIIFHRRQVFHLFRPLAACLFVCYGPSAGGRDHPAGAASGNTGPDHFLVSAAYSVDSQNGGKKKKKTSVIFRRR